MNYFSTTAVQDPKTKRFLTLHAIGKVEKPWRFPGGKLDTGRGESPINAAVRELKEEVGIVPVDRLRFLCVQSFNIDGRDWTGYGFYTNAWIGRPTIEEPHKHDAMEWLTDSQLKERESTFESSLVTLSKITPIQERILHAIVEYENATQVSNEQIAARIGITYSAWRNELDTVRRRAGIRARNQHRAELVAWWIKLRGQLTPTAPYNR